MKIISSKQKQNLHCALCVIDQSLLDKRMNMGFCFENKRTILNYRIQCEVRSAK